VFSISEKDLQAALSRDELRRATNAELIVRISGVIPGLTDANTGEDVQVEFKDEIYALAISNGSQWPQFLGQVSIPKIIGTDKQSVQFRFKGADGQDTKITFSDDLDTSIGLKFISGQICDIPQNVETTCTLELKPSEEAYGTKNLLAIASFTSVDDATQSSEVEISTQILMEKAVKAARGVWTALLLVVVFFLIQGAQRLFFAWLMSRFAALNPINRRARLDIEISESGHVSGRGGSLLSVDDGDESFVFENAEPKSTFYLFGYQFNTSVLRTFMRSTSTPQGLVIQAGKYVFGSAGTQIDKKNAGISAGLVSLSLRNQWVIGINQEDMLRLSDGVGQVNAELVVYLEAPEKASFDQQLSELHFEIAGGHLPQNLSQVIAHLREDAPSQILGRSAQSNGDDSITGTSNVTGFNDPFATSGDLYPNVELSEVENSKVSRFGRKKKVKNENRYMDSDGGVSASDPSDPFA
jgi:hypothetical protein